MGNGPAPFVEIGRRARDLLTKDYNYDQKFSLAISSSPAMSLAATGVKMDDIFIGDISTQYRSEKTTVDVKVDTDSNISTKVTYDWAPGAKAAISFSVPDHKSGKLDVHYLHRHAAINSSIGLHPSPLLEVSAATGFSDIAVGGEIAFDTSTSVFSKCDAGISFSKPDFSAAILLTDKGQILKASYVHLISPLTGTEVAAEMAHSLSGFGSTFSIGSAHKLNAITSVKTRVSDNGKLAVLTRREWRPKSFVTVSAEYDTDASYAATKIGLSIALKP